MNQATAPVGAPPGVTDGPPIGASIVKPAPESGRTVDRELFSLPEPSLVVGLSNGVPVKLGDVAKIETSPTLPEQLVWFGTGPAAADIGIDTRGRFPAVTLAIAKKPGSNAIEVANQVVERIEQLRGIVIPTASR